MIRNDIKKNIQAYPVRSAPEGFIKLDAMEAPIKFDQALQKSLLDELSTIDLNLYPNKYQHPLQENIRALFKIPPQAAIILGNGSDELIERLILLVADTNSKIMAITPTFPIYAHSSLIAGAKFVPFKSHEDFSVDFSTFRKEIDAIKPKLIFIASPNNPTGVRYPEEELIKILESTDALVVIDEAYAPYAAHNLIHLAGKYPNLIVLRTLSKIGFAGIRLGFAAGEKSVIENLNKITAPYNINSLSLAVGDFIVRHYQDIEKEVRLLSHEREIMLAALEDLDYLQVYPSEGNFLLVRTPDAKLFFNILYDNKILVKNLDHTDPQLHHCLRISISSRENNQKLLKVLQSLSSGSQE